MAAMRGPEAHFGEDKVDSGLRARERPRDTSWKPDEPRSDDALSPLRGLEGVVVVRTLLFDLRGETPEAPSAGSLLTCEDEVREGACDTPVSVVEGVEDDEAEVCDAGMYEGVDVGRPGRGEPREEGLDLCGDARRRRRLEVDDGVFAPGSRHDAHGFVPAAECADGHALRPRKPCREECRLPAAEAREGDGRVGVARGVEEDRDEAVHRACRGRCARTI